MRRQVTHSGLSRLPISLAPSLAWSRAIYCLRKSRYANTAAAAAMVVANATNRVSLFLGSVLMEFIAFRVAGIIASSCGGTQSCGLSRMWLSALFPVVWLDCWAGGAFMGRTLAGLSIVGVGSGVGVGFGVGKTVGVAMGVGVGFTMSVGAAAVGGTAVGGTAVGGTAVVASVGFGGSVGEGVLSPVFPPSPPPVGVVVTRLVGCGVAVALARIHRSETS